jgi:pSer/pThr/pTyr-binding forkhead associated (FHA) protein
VSRSTYSYRGKVEVYITIIDGNKKKRIIKLPDFPVRIGRAQDNHIKLDDDLCSSKHLIVSKTKDSVLIKDLNSKNGIALNGIKVFNQKIYIDDIVKVGNTTIYIEKSKLSEEGVKALSPTGKDRANGEITIELELSKRNPSPSKPKSINIDLFEREVNEVSSSKVQKFLNIFKGKDKS